jgi:hypothetical protein
MIVLRNLRAELWLLIGSVGLGACTGSGPYLGSGNSEMVTPSVATCRAQCDLQQRVPNCSTLTTLATCYSICEQVAVSLPAQCGDEYNAYYGCTLAHGFGCNELAVVQATSACDRSLAALDACDNNGAAGSGAGAICAGADSRGACPEVPCPCSSSIVTVSGSSTTATGCACWDTVTCQSHACL